MNKKENRGHNAEGNGVPAYLNCDCSFGVSFGHLFDVSKEASRLQLFQKVFLARPVWLNMISSGTIPDKEKLITLLLEAFITEYMQSGFIDGQIMPFRVTQGLRIGTQAICLLALWQSDKEENYILIAPMPDKQHITRQLCLSPWSVQTLDFFMNAC
jgi:hypothetical protein